MQNERRVTHGRGSSPQVAASASEYGGGADVCGGGVDLGEYDCGSRWRSQILWVAIYYLRSPRVQAAAIFAHERRRRFRACALEQRDLSFDSFRGLVRVRALDCVASGRKKG